MLAHSPAELEAISSAYRQPSSGDLQLEELSIVLVRVDVVVDPAIGDVQAARGAVGAGRERDAGGRLDARGGDIDLPHEPASHRGLEDEALPVTHDPQVVREPRHGDALGVRETVAVD